MICFVPIVWLFPQRKYFLMRNGNGFAEILQFSYIKDIGPERIYDTMSIGSLYFEQMYFLCQTTI